MIANLYGLQAIGIGSLPDAGTTTGGDHGDEEVDMAGPSLTVPWGDGTLDVELPPQWDVEAVLTPAATTPVADVGEAVGRALAAPVGSPTVGELAASAARVAVVVDDVSRPTPVAELLPTVLAELKRSGVSRDAVTVVIALGLHRPMTDEEVGGRLGAATLSDLRWENHDCDAETLVSFGETERGTPVLLNRTVAQADLVVSIGCIEPHAIASFGGGAKNIVPGVAGRATIAHNHGLNCTSATYDQVGRDPDENPMRLDLEEAAGRLRPPVLIVNAILSGGGDVVDVVAGDPVAAHRAGVERSRLVHGVSVTAPVDVVITDSHPMDTDLRQGLKALANTVRAVRPGGALIAFVRAEEGVGVVELAQRSLPLGQRSLRALAPVLLRLLPRIRSRSLGEEERFFLYFALQALRRTALLAYAPTVPAEAQGGMPFLSFVESPAQAVEAARRRVGDRARVLVFPEGGVTYPRIGSA